MDSKTDFGKLFSIIGTLLFCSALLSHSVYYFFFNIHITEFLGVSEVLLLFTDDILRFLIVFLIVIIISLISSLNTPSLKHKRVFIKYTQTTDPWIRTFDYFEYKKSSIFQLLFGLVIIVVLFLNGSKAIYLANLVLGVDLFYVILRFIIYENKRRLRIRGKLLKENQSMEAFSFYSSYFIFFILGWTIIDVQRVKYQGKFLNVSFKTQDSTFVSDSTKYYVGQTEKYLFVYDSKTDKSTALKMDEIKSISFGKILYWGDSTLTIRNLYNSNVKKDSIPKKMINKNL